jgi:predicted DNA repair protein MutK
LLTLLDDIATLLDDISVMGKLAAKKTAGVLGDDLSLNAQQVTGVRANRELPVVWGVAKGSFINKVILVPLALLISAFIPWAITPLLMVGARFSVLRAWKKSCIHLHHEKKMRRHRRASIVWRRLPLRIQRRSSAIRSKVPFVLTLFFGGNRGDYARDCL